MLVNHADAGGYGVARPGEGHGLVVDEDLSGVGLVEAVEDVHERGLARAVLAQEGVDLAGLDSQVDVVVGHERPEGFVIPRSSSFTTGSLPGGRVIGGGSGCWPRGGRSGGVVGSRDVGGFRW